MEQQTEPEQVYVASSRASMSLQSPITSRRSSIYPPRTALCWFAPEAKAVPLLPLTGSTMNLPQTGGW